MFWNGWQNGGNFEGAAAEGGEGGESKVKRSVGRMWGCVEWRMCRGAEVEREM